jgi:hypothetical protein
VVISFPLIQIKAKMNLGKVEIPKAELKEAENFGRLLNPRM